MSTLKFGLNVQKKTPIRPSHPAPAKRELAFGDDDSDADDQKNANGPQELSIFGPDTPKQSTLSSIPSKKTSSAPPSNPSSKNIPQVSQYGDLSSRATSRKRVEEATTLDSSIYDYDAAYDALHAQDAARKATVRAEARERKPKYMDNLLKAAETRKRDLEVAKDRMLQKERETEGDTFKDKEKFVTGAYKERQEQLRLEEEEREKREREEEDRRRRMGGGLASFHKNLLDQDERRHEEIVKAAEEAERLGVRALVDEEPAEKSEADIAKERNKMGGNIILNEEGQVVDKRQLLSGGLNVSKAKGAFSVPMSASMKTAPTFSYQGRNSNQRATRERQTKEIEAQIIEAEKRKREQEEEERQELERKSKSRKTEGEINSARERYLQRKREQAAKAVS